MEMFTVLQTVGVEIEMYYSHLGLHVWTAGVGPKGRQVAQGLGLLLQRHHAVLLEHPGCSSLCLHLSGHLG